MKEGYGTRKLGLIDQRDGYFEGNLCPWFEISSGCQQYPARGEIQSSCKFQELFPTAFSPAYKEGNGNGQTIPVTALRDRHDTAHFLLLSGLVQLGSQTSRLPNLSGFRSLVGIRKTINRAKLQKYATICTREERNFPHLDELLFTL